MKLQHIANIMLFIVLLISCITDIKHNVVKNVVTIPCILVAIILKGFFDSNLLLDSLKGVFIPMLLLIPFYLLGALGAGDIKLFCSIGALMGSSFVIICILYSFLLGGVMSLIIMTYRGVFSERVRYLLNYVIHTLLYLQLQPYTNGKDTKNKLPLALPIMGGVIVTKIFQ